MEKNKKQIGYIPQIEYKDDYYSELEFNDIDNIELNKEIDENKQVVDNLIDNLNNLNIFINKLPNEVTNTIKEVYDPVLEFAENELKDKTVEFIPDEDDINLDNNNQKEDSPNKEDKETDYDIWGTDDFFPEEKVNSSIEEIYEKEFIKNLVDLFYDYSSELQNILSEFWRDYILATSNKSISEIKMMINNILFNSNDVIDNVKHLLDSAIRQQIIKDTKMDFHTLMFNAESTITYLKQLKATQELRIRYSKIEKANGDTKINQLNNNFLEASLMSYNNKYEIAYENLYRYLTSSNKIIRDSFQSWIQEIKSKQILIEREGIKNESTTNGR